MFIDSRLEFSSAQALTATAASSNVVDLGADRKLVSGQPLFLVVAVNAAPDGTTGDETYRVTAQSEDDSDFSLPVDLQSFDIPRDTAAGARFAFDLRLRGERYLRLNYTLGGTTPSITLSAWLTDQQPTAWKAFDANGQE